MALRAAPTGQNKSYSNANTSDRMGGALDFCKKIEAGGFWRLKQAGDGQSAYQATTTTIAAFFSSNSGVGYTTSGQAWNTTIANSWYHPLAWILMEELNNSAATTGRQLLLQRGSATAAAGDNKLTMSFSSSGFTGTANATTSPTSGASNQSLTGTQNGVGGSIMASMNSAQCVIGGSEAIIWNFWDCDRASGTTGNVAACGFTVHGGTTPDRAWQFWYEPLVQAAAADAHPFVLICGSWPSVSREIYADASADIYGNVSNTVCFSLDAAGGYQRTGGDKWTSGGRAILTPGNAAEAMTTDADGKYPLEPVRFTVANNNANDAYKGISETLGRIRPISAAQCWPCLISCSDGTFYVNLGQSLCAPWPDITTTPTGYTLTTSSAFARRGFSVTADTTAPTIGALSPAAGAIASTQALSVSVTDAGTGVGRVVISVRYTSPVRHEIVFLGNSSVAGYDSEWDTNGAVAAITNGYTYSGIVPDAGWRGAFTIDVNAIDASGNTSPVSSTAYTMSATASPTLTSLSPAAGAISVTQALTFRTSDATALTADLIYVTLANGVKEIIWNGWDTSPAFSSGYSAGSTRTIISAGKTFDYSIARTAGWPSAFSLVTESTDADGNTTVTTTSYTMSVTNVPTFANLSPVAGAIAVTQAIAFRTADTTALTADLVYVTLANGVVEVVWDGWASSPAFTASYSGGSTRTQISSGKTYDYSVLRAPGWPSAFSITAESTDADGNVTRTTTAYTMSATNVPTLTSLSPGASAISATQALTFRTTDATALTADLVSIVLANGTVEVVWDGWAAVPALSSQYSTASTRTQVIAGKSYDYSVLRTPGWPSAFSLLVESTDADGNTTRTTTAYTMSASSSPTFTNLSPGASAISVTQAIAFRTADATALSLDIIYVVLASGLKEVIWNGSAFSSGYSAGSTRTIISAGKTFDYSIARTAGWPSAFDLTVYSWDSDANSTTTTTSYTMAATSTPTIASLSPVAGAISVSQAITFRTADATSLVADLIYVVLASGTKEVVWDGSAFATAYSSLSTRSIIVAGKTFDYSIARSPGWPSAFSLVVRSRDVDGNELETTTAYTMSSASTPSLTSASPTSGSSITATQTVTLTFADTLGFSLARIDAAYASVGGTAVTETIYDNSAYANGYSGSVTGTTSKAYQFTRDRGWPADTVLHYQVRDTDATELTGTVTYTLAAANAATISAVSPSPGATAYNSTVAFTLTDLNGIREVNVSAALSDEYETIYTGGTFVAPYAAGSTATPTGTTVLAFSLVRAVGWPSDVTIHWEVIDLDGVITSGTIAYTITGTNPAAPDTSTPVVSLVSPVTGSAVATQSSMSFRVTDDRTLTVQDIWAEYPDSSREQVWDGSAFSTHYSTGSSRTQVIAARSYDFVVARALGWHDDPVIHIRSVDGAANVTNTVVSYTLSDDPAPAINTVSPADSSAILPGATAGFHVVGAAAALQLVTVTAQFTNRQEVVYTGSAFTDEYVSSSRTPITNGYAFVLLRVAGWAGDVVLTVTAVDTDGVISTLDISYTVTGSATGAPVVGPFTPADGTPVTRTQAISFPVTDNSGVFALATISAFFPSTGAWEVVWQKNKYAPYYAGSTRVPITGGYTYTVRRGLGGWPAAPKFVVDVVDTEGDSN